MLLRLTLLLLLPLTTLAQRYPIQATVTLTPPYSPYLTDLTASGAQRLALYLHVTDPTLSDYTCKLRLTIEGVGITLRTRPSFQPIAIPLQGGVPQIFYGEDLIDYFNPNNLDFAGLSRSAFAQTHRLPEGVYRFSIEVLDYNRGTVVSNKATATAWIILNDPPLLNLPRNNNKLSVFDPTNIPFTWTPRHTASPNAAFSSEYVFRLFELPATSPEPLAASSQLSAGSSQLLTAANQAVLSQQPLYETTLAQSQLVYGPGEPALIPGRWYAWQVQAIDTEGRDLFKNRGKSEVFVFQFGDALNMPGNVRKETANHQVISIRWDIPTQGDMPEQYRVLYKPTLSDHWYEDVTKERWHNIGYLKPATTYDIKVRSEKGKQHSEYTTTIQAATTDESSKFQCGGEVNIQPIDLSAAPLPHLLPGDTIRFADFYIMVREAKGNNGQFEGKGSMWVKMFNGASIRVKFSGKINMLYELDGEYESISNMGNWASNLIDDMEKIGEARREEEAKIAAAATLPVTITLTGEIAAVTINPAGDIVITKADGTTETKTHPTDEKTKEKKTLILVDDKGNTWTVSKDGDVSEGGSRNVDLVLDNSGGTTNGYGQKPKETEFMAHQNKIYGFDNTMQEEVWQSLELTKNDKVIYTIKPDSSYNNVYFQGDPSHALLVSPDKATSASQELTLASSGIEGISEVVVSIDSITGEVINNLKVQIYPKKRLNLRIILLHDENDDIQDVAVGVRVNPNTVCVSSGANRFSDTKPNWVGGNFNMNGDDEMDGNGNITVGANGICETEAIRAPLTTSSIDLFQLRDVLNNKVYNQAVFEWNVMDITELTINWDLNRNKMFEMFDYNQNAELVSSEEFKVLDGILKGYDGLFTKDKESYFMIISDHSEPVILNNQFSHPYGFHLKGTRYTFTFGSQTPDVYRTIAHELGHAAFGFEDNTYQSRQTLNLMNHVQPSDYAKRVWLLKEQWGTIQKIGK